MNILESIPKHTGDCGITWSVREKLSTWLDPNPGLLQEVGVNPHNSPGNYFTFPELWPVTVKEWLGLEGTLEVIQSHPCHGPPLDQVAQRSPRLRSPMLTDDYFASLIASWRKTNFFGLPWKQSQQSPQRCWKLSALHVLCTEIMHLESKEKNLKYITEHAAKTRNFCLNELLFFRNYAKLISLNKGLF